jgi:sugar lactone lactonase YvrE
LLRLPNGLLLVCEDHGKKQDHVLVLTPDGRWITLARGRSVGWTGITFSPDGRVLFINQQYVGRTLAITGDWDRLAGI